ncbi:MAG: YjdF family protein [bacterium]|nr:YjdF family protein [bacterium]
MDKMMIKLSVLFDDPFWIGVFEKESAGKLTACKVTFGAEPKDYEVQEFLMKNFNRLRFSPPVDSVKEVKEHINPKRLQRDAKKQLESTGIGTKSQQALKLMQEEGKLERKTKSREQREAEKELQFELKQQKRKEKHRGR